MWVVEWVNQTDNSTFVGFVYLAGLTSGRDRCEVVVCADICGLDAIHGEKVGANISLSDGVGDTEGGFIGVVGFTRGSVVSDEAEYDIGKIYRLTDNAEALLTVLPDTA
jgi:hypothetical protein